MSGSKPSTTPPNQPWTSLHLWQIQGLRDLLMIAAVVAVVWLGYEIRSVTTPLLVALGLAYLFEPIIRWTTARTGLSRTSVVSSLILLLVGAITVALVLSAPLAIRQTASLVDDLRSGRLVRGIQRFETVLPEVIRGPFHEFAIGLGLDKETPEEVIAPESADDGTDEATPPATPDAGATSGAPLDKGATTSGIEHARQSERAPGAADATQAGEATRTDEATRTEPLGRTAGAGHVSERPTAAAALRPPAHRTFTESQDEHIRRVVREELIASHDEIGAGGASGLDATRLAMLLRRGWDTALAVLGFLVQLGLLSFLIPFYFFFFSVSYPAVTAFGASMIPSHKRARSIDLLTKMDGAVAGFVRGRLVISAIVSVVLAGGWLAVGVPYSIVLGVVVGVFNLVPYLSGVGWPIAVALMVFSQLGLPPDQRDSWLWILGAPSVVFLAAQLLDGYVLTPLIAGKATDLDPVTILVAVLAGGSLGGVYGMLLAIPVAACLKILLREVLLPQVKKWVEGRAQDPLPM